MRIYLIVITLLMSACAGKIPQCYRGYEPADAYELDCFEIESALKDPRVAPEVKRELIEHLKNQ